jgi:hypothetical protein
MRWLRSRACPLAGIARAAREGYLTDRPSA